MKRKRIVPDVRTVDDSQSHTNNSAIPELPVLQNWEQSWINYYQRQAARADQANKQWPARIVEQSRKQEPGGRLAR